MIVSIMHNPLFYEKISLLFGMEIKNKDSDENGIDLTQIRENLALTHTERLRKLQRNVDSMQSLLKNSKKVN
ncbi:MAG: hypothetical protein HRT89_02355 [Lentisphaeria bacterium]|nr:hypothetical protein [Lentisphaeria bacterium]NQZ66890.1 hypothetical protein [Lentisphaeria bacterium]